MKKFCQKCRGLGKVSHMGGMKRECPECKGAKFIDTEAPVKEAPKEVKLDKRSKAYKKGLADLKKLGMSEKDAHAALSK